MARGVSIHIGVNRPRNQRGATLVLSETIATNMAALAYHAGYRSIHLLCGAEATCAAVLRLIRRSARTLSAGDTLFVSYAGHGAQVRNRTGADGGYDETLCLADGDLLDKQLLACWRLAPEQARILVVFESCHAAGESRDAYDLVPFCGFADPYLDAFRDVEQYTPPDSSIVTLKGRDDGIRASVLILAAAGESQDASEGLYTEHLLRQWDGGAFPGSYRDLHQLVRTAVLARNPEQEPEIQMLGAPDSTFPNARAFHLNEPVARDGTGGDGNGPDPWGEPEDWSDADEWGDADDWGAFR